MTMGGLLTQAARRWGEDPAIEDGGHRWTFGELRDQARAVSRALVADGLVSGDRIAIWAPNRAEWILLAAGAQQIGIAIVPLNTRYKGREAADIIRRSKAKRLFTVRTFLDMDLAGMLEGEPTPGLDEILFLDTGFDAWLKRGLGIDEAELGNRIEAACPDTIADILYTSGTTGRPKGVMAGQGQTLECSEAWCEATGVHRGDRYLIVNPFFHSFGYKAGWLACLLRGATALPVPVFEAGAVLARIESDRVTVLPGPPTIYQSLLEHPDRARTDLSSLRLAVTGAASVPPVLIRRIRDELGFRDVLTAYGLTEACGTVTSTHPGDSPELIAASCGVPIPGVEVRVIDNEGRDVEQGEPGELLVRGFNVMKGYLDDPDATEAAIDPEGWLHTGDIVTRDPQGYIRVTGRSKDMFICGGFNCYPAEIEAMIMEHPDVSRVAIVGVPDERMGEVARAYIVPNGGATIDQGAFIAWCRARMANFKVPRSIEVVAELPTNASGKVLHHQLRERATNA
jgi:acyl-CoA synthetase (AMP-forming)/AMP-acid ligase II